MVHLESKKETKLQKLYQQQGCIPKNNYLLFKIRRHTNTCFKGVLIKYALFCERITHH